MALELGDLDSDHGELVDAKLQTLAESLIEVLIVNLLLAHLLGHLQAFTGFFLMTRGT